MLHVGLSATDDNKASVAATAAAGVDDVTASAVATAGTGY